ncbi:MAG: hypothetical protein HUK11_06685 [Muribaculaceae bacterium]|nr:hypothetical protein [Muribaculaceae bacterium]
MMVELVKLGESWVKGVGADALQLKKVENRGKSTHYNKKARRKFCGNEIFAVNLQSRLGGTNLLSRFN